MAQFTAIAPATVAIGQNIIFTETPVKGNCFIMHREDSGIVTLRAPQNQCARYLVEFSGNITVAPADEGGVLGPVSVAIAIEGEPLQSTNMIATPAAIGDYFNVSSQAYINVPCGCCVTVAVENTSTGTAIEVQNASLSVARVA